MSDAGRRDIELRIRAQDLSTATFTAVTNAVKGLTGAVDAEVAAAQKAAISNGELTAAMTRLKQAGENLTTLQGLIDRFKDLGGVVENSQRNVDEAAAKLAAYRAQLDSTGNTGRSAERALARLVSTLEKQETALLRNKASLTQTSEALEKAGIDTRNLAAAETELKASADLIGPALTKLNQAHLDYTKNLRLTKEESAKLRAEEKTRTEGLKKAKKAQDDQTEALRKFNEETKKLAATQRSRDQQSRTIRDQEDRDRATLAVRGTTRGATPGATGATTGLFGLRPYELQNLSYQINDIVSGLASGQKVTQIFAQQGGQVLQLFNKNLFALGAYLPTIAAGAAAATVAVLALAEAFRVEGAIRTFTATLTASGERAGYTVQQLTALRREVERFGISSSDAIKLIQSGVQAGIPIDRLKDYIQVAKDAAYITGKTLPDSMKLLIDVFEGGFNEVEKLNKELGSPLRSAELAAIQNAYQLKGAQEGATLAIQKFGEATHKAAGELRSPFEAAILSVKESWRGLLEVLADSSVFTAITNAVNGLGTAIKNVSDFIRDHPVIARVLGGAAAGAAMGAAGGATALGIGALPGAAIGGITGAGVALNAAGDANNAARGTGQSILAEAATQLGQTRTSAELRQFMQAGGSNLDPATVAWCAAFANAVLARQGIQGTGSNIATSFETIGKGIGAEQPRAGDIVVNPKGAGPGETGGHVGFATGEMRGSSTGSGIQFEILSGNYQHQVAKSWVDAAEVIVRRVTGGAAPATAAASAVVGSETYGPPAPGASANAAQARVEAGRQASAALAQQVGLENTLNEKSVVRLTYEKELAKQLEAHVDQTTAEGLATEASAKKQAEFDQIRRQQAAEDAINTATWGKYAVSAHEAGAAAANVEIAAQKAANAERVKGIEQAVKDKTATDQDLATLKDLQAGVVDASKVRAAYLEGERKAVADLTAAEQLRSQNRTVQNQVAALLHQQEMKDLTDLSVALQGVSDKYVNIRNNIKKMAEEQANPSLRAQALANLTSLEPQIQRAESLEKSNVTAKFYLDQLQSISTRRQELIAAENAAVTAGAQTQTEAEEHIKAAYMALAPEIETASTKLKEFLETDKNIDSTRIELYTAKMKALRAEAKYVSPEFKELKGVIENSFVSNATNALNTVSEAIGNAIAKTAQWKDVWRSVGVAVGQFFAGLFKDIATAIIKIEALKLLGLGGGGGISGGIAGLFTGGSTGSGGGLFSLGGLFGSQGSLFGSAADASIAAGGPPLALALHSGGVVGRAGGTPRTASPSWFANAPRYHSGSIVGLAPDEQAAILRRGEEVLAQNNPRNIMNGGGGIGGQVAIRNVLVMDPAQIPAAMSGAHGEKVTISHIVNNIATVRQLVRG